MFTNLNMSKLIRLQKITIEYLDKQKIIPDESYNSLLIRLLKINDGPIE